MSMSQTVKAARRRLVVCMIPRGVALVTFERPRTRSGAKRSGAVTPR